MMVWVTPGRVSWVRRAAVDASMAVTPGTMAHATPFSSRLSICSRMAPYMVGSPSCSRTVTSPRDAASYSISVICSRTIPDASCSVPPHISSMGRGISDPEYTTVPAALIRLAPFTVMSSGSPGPHPTK